MESFLVRECIKNLCESFKRGNFMTICFREKNLREWNSVLNRLFPDSIPKVATWERLDDIVTVLTLISSVPSLNHLFYPHGGGNDLTGCTNAYEDGCLELKFGSISEIIKPTSLTFNSCDKDNLEWAYFRIETGRLDPVLNNEKGRTREELCELTPGQYVERSFWDMGYLGYDGAGNEMRLPASARPVTRNFEGSYVIFAKGSVYNKTPSTNDGRHNKISSDEFRTYITSILQ
jgi:serine/threonine-protein kinase